MSLLLFLLSLVLEGEWAQGRNYLLLVQKTVKVQEGLCVVVSCSFFSPERRWRDTAPAYGYWFKVTGSSSSKSLVATNDKDKIEIIEPETQGRFQLLGDVQKKNCSLMIKDVQQRDSSVYSFRVEKGVEKFSFRDGFFLLVEALTHKPDVFIPEILEPGQPATAVCLFHWAFEQCPVPSFSWMGAAISSQESRPHTSPYSVLSFTPGPQHHDTELICQVDLPRRSLQRTVQLSVAYAPRDLAISIFRDNVSGTRLHGNTSHLEVQQGQSLRLLCDADSHPPATLSWSLEDRILSRSSPVGSRTLGLELPRVKVGDSGHYTCQAENRRGSQRHILEISVLLLEILRNGTSLPVLEGQSLCLVCVTHSNPPANLSWTGVAQTLILAQSSEPGMLELPLVQKEHEGEFICAAQNPLGAQRISLSLSVHSPPQMPRSSCSWEAESLHCSCSSRAWPAPSLRWRLGEGLLEGNGSNGSFQVTSSSTGPWANSSLSLHGVLWPSLSLSCEAWNTHGARSASVLLLPGKESPTAFSKGALLGFGVAALIALGFIMIIVKTRQKKGTQEETSRPKISRGSTILDYINVVPKPRSLAPNRKAKPDTPPRIPSQDTHSPESKKRQKEPPFTSPGCPDPKSSSEARVSENNPEELHYAALNFPRLRLWETQNPQDTDYAEVRFH
ncbi:sialic acid-binding Ig-like lectin 10 isoform X2 [Microtus oregoni]|uniref:sialic acid-binding Ig-like lectin 10 isoform X2 n=1 Tax=Microtus oregoni TaxID=111838 RepID=UPI001BB2151D|nr:sialic acid-binding Ig-like lectin 10 isoform X2 [Microtus oregoni]